MPKLSQRVTTKVSATQDLTIEPALRTKLVQRLAKLKKLQAEADAAQAKADKEQANIEGYFEQVGANTIRIEDRAFEHATITQVNGTSSKLDKQLFVRNGGSLKVLEDSTITTPKKPYVLITFAKE